jgi:hypothetical protein
LPAAIVTTPTIADTLAELELVVQDAAALSTNLTLHLRTTVLDTELHAHLRKIDLLCGEFVHQVRAALASRTAV